MTLARRLEKGPPLAYARIKSAVIANWGDLEAALRREREGQIELLKTKDMNEGVAAWEQKREPAFTGR
jgi:enoyl-CoA hydratase/carnithine racemase